MTSIFPLVGHRVTLTAAFGYQAPEGWVELAAGTVLSEGVGLPPPPSIQSPGLLSEGWVFTRAVASSMVPPSDLLVEELKIGVLEEGDSRVAKALELARKYGQIDGGHHKAWAIDQMVRALLGDAYESWVREACDGEDGPETYEWDEGTPP